MNRTVVVAALGTAQTLAWASSYYLPAILADPIADGTGVSRAVVFAIFSGSLLLSAVFGPAVGRAIDQHGGRGENSVEAKKHRVFRHIRKVEQHAAGVWIR